MKTRERLEHELRLAQKLEAIGQLAAGVAHEINTPMQYVGDNIEFLGRVLTGVTGYLTAIHEAIAGDSVGSLAELRTSIAATQKKSRIEYLIREAPKALRASQDGIGHVSNIVRAMKSFAHVDSDDMSAADLNRAISDTLIVAQNEYKSVATVETDLGQLPEVVCFVGKLSQVFLNLVVNAAHAIADAQRDGGGLIKVSSRQVDDCVEVRVSDNGCGISEANRHRVFDQFFTTKEVGRGTGQGLSLARRIVMESHAGTLSFESEPGVGTTFCVRLPIAGRVGAAAA
jgi:two-component system, NtrC family, sensor kinase